MNPEVSVLIPAIRTHQWWAVHDTLGRSCARHSYELVFAGPFEPPPELRDIPNIKYLKTYTCPSVAGQLGAELCTGKLLLHSVDDAHFIPGAVDACVDLYYQNYDRKNVINTRYTEGDGYLLDPQGAHTTTGPDGKLTFVTHYWDAWSHAPLRLPGVPQSTKLALHFLVDLEYFRELGGFDCAYEYMNFNLHDLMLRIQHDGGKVILSPTDVTHCNHYRGRSIDHGPIVDAHDVDCALFVRNYSDPNYLKPDTVRIPYDNWKQRPGIWERRFKRLYASYDEMLADKS